MNRTKKIFPRPGSMSEELRVYGLGIAERMPPHLVERPHGAKHHLAIVFHGAATISGRGRRDRHPAHRLVFWPPGRPHAYGDASASWSHSWIAFDGSAACALVASSGIPSDAPVSTDSAISLEYFAALHGELGHRSGPDPVIIRNLIHSWLRACARAMTDDGAGRPVPRPFVDLRQRLQDHCHERVDLALLERRMRLSRWHLCRAYRRWFGTTPMEDLQRIRMQKAVDLARDPSLTIAEIAASVGYGDVFHFSKQFKKHFGMSPSNMRSGFWGEPSAGGHQRGVRRGARR